MTDLFLLKTEAGRTATNAKMRRAQAALGRHFDVSVIRNASDRPQVVVAHRLNLGGHERTEAAREACALLDAAGIE